jgi:hypothetical protein
MRGPLGALVSVDLPSGNRLNSRSLFSSAILVYNNSPPDGKLLDWGLTVCCWPNSL